MEDGLGGGRTRVRQIDLGGFGDVKYSSCMTGGKYVVKVITFRHFLVLELIESLSNTTILAVGTYRSSKSPITKDALQEVALRWRQPVDLDAVRSAKC